MVNYQTDFCAWAQQQAKRQERSWTLTIKEQRIRLFKALKTSPSLKSQLQSIILDAYEVAILKAENEIKLDESLFPESYPWNLTQILDDTYYLNA
ncbi:MAG: DUF29 domain-containing protein [Methylococcales bacterium]|nr:DUF29 domain-containing protein [Methylococcales bacterium]